MKNKPLFDVAGPGNTFRYKAWQSLEEIAGKTAAELRPSDRACDEGGVQRQVNRRLAARAN